MFVPCSQEIAPSPDADRELSTPLVSGILDDLRQRSRIFDEFRVMELEAHRWNSKVLGGGKLVGWVDNTIFGSHHPESRRESQILQASGVKSPQGVSRLGQNGSVWPE